MNIDRVELLLPRQWPTMPPIAIRRRLRPLGISLTLAERRLLLGTIDLWLINTALVTAVIFWGDFSFSLMALISNFKWFVTLSALWLILGAALDIYNPARAASATQSLLYVGMAALLTTLLYLAIPWLTPPLGRRLQAFGFICLAAGSLTTWRIFYAQLLFQPAFRHRVLLIAGPETDPTLIQELRSAGQITERANPFRGTGYTVVGIIEDTPTAEPDSVPTADNLIHQVREWCIDEIIIGNENSLSPLLREAILDCWELGIRVTPLSTAYERLTARLPVEYAKHNLRLVTGATGTLADSPAERLFRVSKRLVDLGLALVGILLVALLIPLIALGNKLTSPGPLFYCQHRVGRGGRPFVLCKFRTMIPNAEQSAGAVWAAEADPRVTPIGRWLRRTRLDELPQFFNVLRGEMSVIGPRPERPQFVGQLVHHLPLYRARHAIRPGITGWAQVHYRYGNSMADAKIKLEFDLYYIKHAGFFLDILIFLQTIPVMLQFKGF